MAQSVIANMTILSTSSVVNLGAELAFSATKKWAIPADGVVGTRKAAGDRVSIGVGVAVSTAVSVGALRGMTSREFSGATIRPVPGTRSKALLGITARSRVGTMASALPGCTARVLPGEGSFLRVESV